MNQQTVFPSGRIARWIDVELERDLSPELTQNDGAAGEGAPTTRARDSLRYRPFQALSSRLRR
jgi:hypothetical protein